ncbi:MAG TPA: hypothetical protein VGT03_07960 [Candidatus Acidoferrales bacterium]|nr:hypothetical protein [Candidatus Acidoferrales bacterium]
MTDTRIVRWILIALILTGLQFWIVVGPWYPKNSFVLFLLLLFFAVPSIGAFWMLYMVVRHEKHQVPLILVALVPFMFLWYYFELGRTRKLLTRELTDND